MYILRSISVIVTLALVPVFAYATTESSLIGAPSGLDFYSRIDDAGGALAQGIVMRRISQKSTYGSLGCGVRWISGIKMDLASLEALASGNPSVLTSLARKQGISLTTESELSLRSCLAEQYTRLQIEAAQDQDTLETVGNIGLYMDGDTANSEYDIVSDISRINSILFKEKYPYTGQKNNTASAIAKMLRGEPITPLSLVPSLAGGTLSTATSTTTDSSLVTPPASGSPSGGVQTQEALPWAGLCAATPSTTAGGVSGDIFGDGFFTTLDATLAGDTSSLGYSPPPVTQTQTSLTPPSASTPGSISSASDYYHSPACDGILCITIDMRGGSQRLLGGSSTYQSIESLLDRHIEMMEPISYSDLSMQFMTKNTYENASKKKNFADQIAGAQVYTTTVPQKTTTLKKDDTIASRDAAFDDAYRCAMNQAGLSGDPLLAGGSPGAGYTGLEDSTTVSERTILLGPTEISSLAGCYTTRMGAGARRASSGFSTDLDEIQAFTAAMMQMIGEILDTDRKLDTLPVK